MSTPLTGRSTVVATREQVSCDLKGEAVILSMKDGKYYGLNPVGARVWQLIQSPQTVDQIRDQILKEYEVPLDRCESDLYALLEQLAENRLIEVRHEGPA